MTRENRRNLYRILHVQPDSPLELIKSSYRTLMQKLKHHPDLGGDHWNASLINEAYRILSNPDLRETYDKTLLQDLRSRRGTKGPDVSQTEDSLSQEKETRPTPTQKDKAISSFCYFCKTPFDERNTEQDDCCTECESPLFQPIDLNAGDQVRATARFPKTGRLSYYTFWPQAATSAYFADLSVKGVKIITSTPIDNHMPIKIDSSICKAVGKVVFCQLESALPRQYAIGIEFLTVMFHQNKGSILDMEA